MKKDIQGFLKDLAALTDKYGICIEGCGCCGSPYLSNSTLDDFEELMDKLKYDKQTKLYSVNELEEDGYESNGILYYPDGTEYTNKDATKEAELKHE